MLEIVTRGFFVGAPHDVGAAGALVRSDGEELARLQQRHGAGPVRSGLGAELAILSKALRWALERGDGGEAVIVRTGLGSLAAACRGGGKAPPPDLRETLAELEALAREFPEIRAVVSPGWVTARAEDLALRSILGGGR
jgi:hypothetical protein